MTKLKKTFNNVLKVTVYLGILGVGVYIVITLNELKRPIIQTQHIIEKVEIPKYIEKIKLKEVKVPAIKYIPTEKVIEKEKISLPDWLKSATDTLILSIGEIPYRHNYKAKVFSLLNTKTGTGELFYYYLPQPPRFIEFLTDGRVGISYDPFQKTFNCHLTFNFFRIWKAYFGVKTFLQLNTPTYIETPFNGIEMKFPFQYFIGLQLEFKL